MIDYSNVAFTYDSDRPTLNQEGVRPDVRHTNHTRSRSYKSPTRRSRRRPASAPGCGIGARRNRRWSW